MKESESIPVGTVVHGRYRIVRRLGEGGMGSVYLVEHVHTGQELALKVLNAKMAKNDVAIARFRRESRAPGRIQSDHVVQVTDADVAPELGNVPFLVMELLRGQSFDQLLGESEALRPQETLTFLGQVARALDKAHQLGIIHRDIKPENLFLTHREDGTPCVKLLDFGIAKLTESDGDPTSVSKTATGAIFGTPLYMAPEQILGRPERISPQTDIWALGIMAHRMLVGREPWTAQTLPHLVAQIAYEPLPVPSKLGSAYGPKFDSWFARCCARETTDRFASASDAVSALASALGVETALVSSQNVELGSSRREPIRSRPISDDALAETAVATASSDGGSAVASIGSDTLAAQVAPKKSANRFVAAAAVVAVLGVGFAIYLASRNPSAPSEPGAQPVASEVEPPPPPTAQPPPLVEPSGIPTPAPTTSETARSAPADSAPIKKPGSGAAAKPPSGPAVKPGPTTKSTASPPPTSNDPLDQGRK